MMKIKIPTYFTVLYLAFTAVMMQTSCSSQLFGSKVKEPMSGRKYESDGRYFRAVGSGESRDLNMAKRKAMISAKGELAGQVKTQMKHVADLYLDNASVEASEGIEEKFLSLTRELVNQEISQLRVIEQQTYFKKGVYHAFISYEIKKSEMFRYLKRELKLRNKWSEAESIQIENALDQEIQGLEED